ncbi:MAG: hypothetical protein MR868_01815 [Lachnospiraceae bacterium]|nr:hypothetical protein [Lachnospiraceae bacterium]
MISKDKMSVTVGVAFVWFTTQFGGGFASGNQLRQYFVSFGIWAFITCIMAQCIGAFYQWYALKYAKKHEVYDYKSFNDSFYGKYAPIFSNLYELVYIVTICVAPAAAFATGVSTMEAAFGINHWIGTVFVGVFIFIVAVYGTNVVRKVAATLSVLIVVGLFAVYIPNIITQWTSISANISASMANPAPAGKAIWTGIVYAAFQLASIGLLVQHAKPFESPDDAKTSMLYGLGVNVVIVLMAVLGLMAITDDPNFAKESIPLLILVNKGVAPEVLRPIISILIVLGSVSTAVNMIAGMSNRVCSSLDKNFDPTAKPGTKVIVVTAVCTLVAFLIAQLGLNKIVAVGYKYLGYLTIPVIMIPYVVHMIATKCDNK